MGKEEIEYFPLRIFIFSLREIKSSLKRFFHRIWLVKLFVATNREKCWEGVKEKAALGIESRLLNIVVSMMKQRIIYSLMSQWPPNVEEPTRSILFWAFSFSMCFCIALALIPILSTSSCLVIYGLSFINSKTFSIVFGDPVWPPVWPLVWPLVWPPVSLGIGNRSSTSCNSYLSINSGLPQPDTLKLLYLQGDRFVSIKKLGAALG